MNNPGQPGDDAVDETPPAATYAPSGFPDDESESQLERDGALHGRVSADDRVAASCTQGNADAVPQVGDAEAAWAAVVGALISRHKDGVPAWFCAYRLASLSGLTLQVYLHDFPVRNPRNIQLGCTNYIRLRQRSSLPLAPGRQGRKCDPPAQELEAMIIANPQTLALPVHTESPEIETLLLVRRNRHLQDAEIFEISRQDFAAANCILRLRFAVRARLLCEGTKPERS